MIAMMAVPAAAIVQPPSPLPPGRPYEIIWNLLRDLQDQISFTQSTLQKAIEDGDAALQAQLDHIQLIPGPAGEKGEKGDPGPACWDQNENGVCDPSENVNGDAACDVMDCQGPQGETGPAGQDGAPGSPGSPGADGKDGARGDPGLACWDLNENGACDLDGIPPEDKNGDETCDATDCQGPQGPRGARGEKGDPGAPGGTDLTSEMCLMYKISGAPYPPSISATCNALYPTDRKLVFLTSEEFTGNLGGFTGADANCTRLAIESGHYVGLFKAWIENPHDRFTHPDVPYVDLNGNVIANDFDDLTSCYTTHTETCLRHAIEVDEKGTPYAEPQAVWTGVNAGGYDDIDLPPYGAGLDCSLKPAGLLVTVRHWWSESHQVEGVIGDSSRTDRGWTENTYSHCDERARLYCFEQ